MSVRGGAGRLLAAAVAAALVAGCVQPPPRDVRLTWLDATPAGVVPIALTTSAAGVLVGGTDASDSGPALVSPAGEQVPLVPSEPYAASARIVAATAGDGHLYLIGGRAGGAHENTRWTVWDGPLSGPVTSRPQEFFTFGGHDAGPLLGTVVVDGRPVIVGSRGGDAGPDIALYTALDTADGSVWRQLDTPPALHSSNGVVLGFTATAAAGSIIVVVGDSVRADATGTVQTPALFYGPLGGPWRRLDLPVPTSGPGLRHATSVACGSPATPASEGAAAGSPSRAATTCWVAGWAGHPVVWQVSLPDGVLVSTALLPGEPPATGDPVALAALVGGRPVIATNALTPSLVVLCGSSWTTLSAPGEAVAVAGAGGDGYLVAHDRLWRASLPTC
ncbi:MAG: hypothetical protein HY829_11915 [Actinobacteria bacterium]|nr:hypothetical protein [Actinomycetota bacterium]